MNDCLHTHSNVQKLSMHNGASVCICSNVAFHYPRGCAAYFGGMCSVSRGVGVIEVSESHVD